MYDSVIKLVKTTVSVNAYGDRAVTETNKTVFCDVKSISQSEFYQAQATGLKPEIKFVLPDYLEYGGEEKILFADYNGTEEDYRVVRTYKAGNQLEIVCKRGVDR